MIYSQIQYDTPLAVTRQDISATDYFLGLDGIVGQLVAGISQS